MQGKSNDDLSQIWQNERQKWLTYNAAGLAKELVLNVQLNVGIDDWV